MTIYEMAKKNYNRKLWTDDMLANLVSKAKLTVSEYKEITGGEIEDPTATSTIIAKKLNELSAACEDAISSGVDVTLSDGTTEHFSLEDTDQTNIESIFNAVVLGATEYPYHADDGACKMYAAVDIVSIYVAAKTLVTYHTTYFNAMKQWVNRLETAEEVQAIKYGDELPEDLATSMNEIIANAQVQMNAILAKLQS